MSIGAEELVASQWSRKSRWDVAPPAPAASWVAQLTAHRVCVKPKQWWSDGLRLGALPGHVQ